MAESAPLLASFALLLALGHGFPLRPATQPFAPRMWVNLVMTALTFATAAVTVRPVTDALLPWTRAHGVGLLPWLTLPTWVEAALALLLLDLSFYYWHRATHRVGWLWRLHAVHHVDPDLDVTTAARFHPVEIAVSVGFRALQVLAIGASPPVYLGYVLAFQLATQLHHSNIALPAALDRALAWVIVTPRVHGLHHSQRRDETHANYGVVLTIWDRAHRTWRRRDQGPIVIGLPGFARVDDNRLTRLLLLPRDAQRAELYAAAPSTEASS